MSPRLSIREGLAAAACALVGVSSPTPVDATEIDASYMYWAEGSRVNVNETVLNFRKPLANERVFNAGVTIDVMTGASANGALPANGLQTFTRPSGRGGYVVQPGEVPLDDTFQDNRLSTNAGITTPLGRVTSLALGAHFSIEYDYQSAGANAYLTRDFNKRNTTVALGGAFSWDIASPEGGTPVPFSSMLPAGTTPARLARTDDKYITDLLVGVTQVIDRATLARVNYSLSYSSGYHTDPFKLLSVLDTDGEATDYVFERRPDTRTKQSVYALIKRYVAGDVIDASYRFMSDDWGVRSHTVEARYRWELGARRYLQPQYRFYTQNDADFFAGYLSEDAAFPDFASADYRLGAFDAHTIAVKYGVRIGDVHEVNVRLGYYIQQGDRSPPELAALRGLDLFPDVNAYLLQIGYSVALE